MKGIPGGLVGYVDILGRKDCIGGRLNMEVPRKSTKDSFTDWRFCKLLKL